MTSLIALLLATLLTSVRPDNVDLYLRPQYTAEGEYLKEYLRYRSGQDFVFEYDELCQRCE